MISVENTGMTTWRETNIMFDPRRLGPDYIYVKQANSSIWRLKAHAHFRTGESKDEIAFDAKWISIVYKTPESGEAVENASGIFKDGGESLTPATMIVSTKNAKSGIYSDNFELDLTFIAPKETGSISSVSIRLNDCAGIPVILGDSSKSKDKTTVFQEQPTSTATKEATVVITGAISNLKGEIVLAR